MKTLIVGGTGLTGATTAKHLASKGHEVTLMSRSKPENPALAEFDFIAGNYIDDDIPVETLQGFDWLVFAAGADLRMQPRGESDESFFTRANTVAIPRFFEKAKAAGIKRTVYIGSYYPQVVPEKIESSIYVKSRHLADEAIRAMSDESFNVCSLNAPFILGYFPGVNAPHLEGLVHYCAGHIEGKPLVAPEGGVNHISALSMAEAAEAALERGESGKAYLVGDENLTWKQYLELFCELAGNPQELETSPEEHFLFPDIIMYAGRGALVSYEPDDSLGYSRNQIRKTIGEVVEGYL